MRPPIVVDARGELLFFKSRAAAEGWVEEIDIENQEYGDRWDADGTLLKLAIEAREERILRVFRWRYRRPVLRQESAPAGRASEFRTALVGFLEKQGAGAEELKGKGLPELVDLGVANCGWT
jgi:hypothetical protein